MTTELDPIHAGEILLNEFVLPSGLSINQTAHRLHVPPNRIADICRGRRSITADTAIRLAQFYSVSVEVWTGLQSDYELRVARRKLGDNLNKIQPIPHG